MTASTLTATTVRYLFASTWAPRDDSGRGMWVPGAKVPGLDTAANLLDIAVWSLREQGLVEVRQLRPVETERVVTFGGRSFASVRGIGEAKLAGLEGALLEKILEPPEAGLLGRFDDAIAKALSGDDENGLRGHLLALDLGTGSPWVDVASYCLTEARDAGLIEVRGRLFKKMSIADPAALKALRARNDRIAAARKAHREREAELDAAVIADCVTALDWARQSSD